MSTWIWASRFIEKEIARKCSEHATHVMHVAEALLSMVQHVAQGNAEAARADYQRAFESERKADELKRSILEDVTRITLHPLDREYVVRLVLTVDDVAAYAKATARRLLIALDLGYTIDRELVGKLQLMASKLSEASKLLVQAIEALVRDPSSALMLADKIEKIEEEVDEIRMDALEIAFKLCRDRSVDWCLIAKDIVDSLENACDRCEDAGDMVRLIAISLK